MWLDRDVPFAVSFYRDGIVGTLVDPQTEIYKTWYSYIRSYKTDYMYPDELSSKGKTGSFWASSFLYSPYQLLLVPKLRDLIPQMKMRRRYRKHPSLWKSRLRLDTRLEKEIKDAATENRDLTITLTALEAKYVPRLRGHRFSSRFSGTDSYVEELIAYQHSFDPTNVLKWIGWDAEKVKKTAEKLLFWLII